MVKPTVLLYSSSTPHGVKQLIAMHQQSGLRLLGKIKKQRAEIDELVDMLEDYIIFARRLKKEDEPWSDRENERELKAMRITNKHRGK